MARGHKLVGIKAVVFDLDGVFYLRESRIHGGAEAVSFLREAGVKVFFLSNASTHSRRARLEILKRFGIDAKAPEIYSTAYGAARYVSSKKRNAKVLCLGGDGLDEEMRGEGHSPAWEGADFVVIGLDADFDYLRLSKAFKAVLAGAEFISTNRDRMFPVEDGFLPGAGAMVGALEASTGVRSFTIGKPETHLMELILSENKLKPEEVLLVGDSLETDFELAKRMKTGFALVLTGVTKRKDLEGLKGRKPDFVLGSIAELPSLLSD